MTPTHAQHQVDSSNQLGGYNSQGEPASSQQLQSTLPPLPSPAFLIMVELLSSGDLLQCLVSILTNTPEPEKYAKTSAEIAMTIGLFGSTPPDFEICHVSDKRREEVFLEDLLVSLDPIDYLSEPCKARDRMIILALECLCAAVAREDRVMNIVSQNQVISRLIPVLGFSESPGSLRQNFMGQESLMSCANTLHNLRSRQVVLSSIVQIQWISSNAID